MVNEILDFLKIQPGETGFDATLGYGGHTKAMMECLHGEGPVSYTHLDVYKRQQQFGGMSQKEIAAVLHITPENVRVLAYRAKKELKKDLEELKK